MGLSLLLCGMGECGRMIPELLAIFGCPRSQLREDVQPATVWIPGPLNSVGPLLLSCLVLAQWLQAPNMPKVISVAVTQPLGVGRQGQKW